MKESEGEHGIGEPAAVDASQAQAESTGSGGESRAQPAGLLPVRERSFDTIFREYGTADEESADPGETWVASVLDGEGTGEHARRLPERGEPGVKSITFRTIDNLYAYDPCGALLGRPSDFVFPDFPVDDRMMIQFANLGEWVEKLMPIVRWAAIEQMKNHDVSLSEIMEIGRWARELADAAMTALQESF